VYVSFIGSVLGQCIFQVATAAVLKAVNPLTPSYCNAMQCCNTAFISIEIRITVFHNILL
jgi:hypothetical protein